MERVETLLKKLQEQFAQGASPGQLLLTVQMLQVELALLQEGNNDALNSTISVIVSQNTSQQRPAVPAPAVAEAEKPEEKIIEILQVDEAEIEAELEEIKKNAEAMQKISVQNKPQLMFDADDDIPTLSHQQQQPKAETPKKEINEHNNSGNASVNDKLKQSRIDLGDTLTEIPIRDLKKAIGVNDRFLFINELFRGDEVAYERSIKTINSFSILAEAEYWIQRELKVKNGWTDRNEVVLQFYQLVKRRFS